MPTKSDVGPFTALSGILGKISYFSQCPIFPFPPYLALQVSQLPWRNLSCVWANSWAAIFSLLPLISPTLAGGMGDTAWDLGTLPGGLGTERSTQVLHKLFCFHQERESGSCWFSFAFRGEERNRLWSPEVALWSLLVKGSTFQAQYQEAFCNF